MSDSICKYLPDIKSTTVQGFGGLTASRLLGKLKNRVFPFSECSNIIIHVGTNDIFAINCSQFQIIMKEIIQEIRKCNPSTLILLSSILPRPVDFKDSKMQVAQFNNSLKELANTNNIRFMACEKSFFNRYGYPIKCLFQKDKLHLSFTGLTKLQQFIANTLAHL